tara:strand:+ start:199 stop:381 length:183 start_codon:yes stop_codon:yes gene_type:complete
MDNLHKKKIDTNNNTNNIIEKTTLNALEKKIMLTTKCKHNINNINYFSDDNEMTQLGYDG